MRLEKLIADIDEAVYQRIMENRTVSEEEAKETAKIVGLAALKYGDLSNQASKDISLIRIALFLLKEIQAHTSFIRLSALSPF